MAPRTVGVDLGGTKILAGRLVEGGLVDVSKRDTPTGGPEEVLAALAEVVREVAAGALDCVGVGVPGPADPVRGTVGPAPNLAGWDRPLPVRDRLEQMLGVPVVVENDANAAAVGEHRGGAGRGAVDVLGVWVGTGVGGGLILDGAVRRGRGLAGELGHVVVRPGGRPCGCGGLGHLEAYAGRAAMEREARRRHESGESTLLVEIAGDRRMKSSVFEQALRRDDEVAASLVEEAVEALSVAVAGATLLVDLERVVLGGGLAHRLGESFRSDVEAGARRLVFRDTRLTVVPSELGDDAGALGAAALAADRYPREE